jgi:predicted nucleic acid-binding protein
MGAQRARGVESEMSGQSSPITIFIDANVFLGLYSYSDDDLEQLKKIKALIDGGQVKLIVTDQIADEVSRNRETRTSDAIKEFSKEKLSAKVPILMRAFEQF